MRFSRIFRRGQRGKGGRVEGVRRDTDENALDGREHCCSCCCNAWERPDATSERKIAQAKSRTLHREIADLSMLPSLGLEKAGIRLCDTFAGWQKLSQSRALCAIASDHREMLPQSLHLADTSPNLSFVHSFLDGGHERG
eukprot:2406361-Rhodomonas_salina.3